MVAHFTIAHGCENERVDAERQANGNQPALAPARHKRRPNRTEERGQGVSPQAGRAFTFAFVALLPPPFQTDQKADGEGNGKALKKFDGIHGARCYGGCVERQCSTPFTLSYAKRKNQRGGGSRQ
jgi:hypothetical protein